MAVGYQAFRSAGNGAHLPHGGREAGGARGVGRCGAAPSPPALRMARWCCPTYGSRGHSRLEGTCESPQWWQSITSVVPLPPGWAVNPDGAEQPGGAAPAPGEGRGSRTPPPAAQEPPMSPRAPGLPCPAFPSLTPSFSCLKMGETSLAAGPGLPSSPSPPPPSPRSACSPAPPLGKGPGGDIAGVSSLRPGRAAHPIPVCLTVSLSPSSPWPDTPRPDIPLPFFPAWDSWWD